MTEYCASLDTFPPRILHFISNCVYMVYTWYTASQLSRYENSFPEWLEKCSSNKAVPDFPLLYFWFQWWPRQHAGRAQGCHSKVCESCSEPTAACVTGFPGFKFHPVPYSRASSYKALPELALTVHMPFCQLPKMLHKSCQDLDQDNKTDFGLHVLTSNGRLQRSRRLVSLCCWMPLCCCSSHKGWDVVRVSCLHFGELAFTAAR